MEVVAHDLGGSGPLLLMLHANGFHGLAFEPMVSGGLRNVQRRCEVRLRGLPVHLRHGPRVPHRVTALPPIRMLPMPCPCDAQVSVLGRCYRCIALDLPGHGSASLAEGTVVTVDALLQAVLAWVERHELSGVERMLHVRLLRVGR